jgi:hypothetical protein
VPARQRLLARTVMRHRQYLIGRGCGTRV